LIVVLCALVFGLALPRLAQVWATTEYFAYGFLIPVVSLLLVNWRRPALRRVAHGSDARGWSVIALSFLVFLFGYVSDSVTFIGLGSVGAIAGIVLAVLGPAALRVLAFPIGYLLFCVPLPVPVIAPVITSLRLYASDGALRLLRLADLPVMREGNVILIPEGSLFVDEACSGISSVITLLPAAVLLGYLTQKGWRSKGLLIASVVPIAVFWNLVRVTVTVATALAVGIDRAAASSPHEFAGMITYALGCGSLLVVDSWLRRGFGAREPGTQPTSAAMSPEGKERSGWKRFPQ